MNEAYGEDRHRRMGARVEIYGEGKPHELLWQPTGGAMGLIWTPPSYARRNTGITTFTSTLTNEKLLSGVQRSTRYVLIVLASGLFAIPCAAQYITGTDLPYRVRCEPK